MLLLRVKKRNCTEAHSAVTTKYEFGTAWKWHATPILVSRRYSTKIHVHSSLPWSNLFRVVTIFTCYIMSKAMLLNEPANFTFSFSSSLDDPNATNWIHD